MWNFFHVQIYPKWCEHSPRSNVIIDIILSFDQDFLTWNFRIMTVNVFWKWIQLTDCSKMIFNMFPKPVSINKRWFSPLQGQFIQWNPCQNTGTKNPLHYIQLSTILSLKILIEAYRSIEFLIRKIFARHEKRITHHAIFWLRPLEQKMF